MAHMPKSNISGFTKRTFSPLEIKIVLHSYTQQTMFEGCNLEALQKIINKFVDDGILKPSGTTYLAEITDKGKAWIELMLNTQYPKQKWVDNQGNIINFN